MGGWLAGREDFLDGGVGKRIPERIESCTAYAFRLHFPGNGLQCRDQFFDDGFKLLDLVGEEEEIGRGVEQLEI